MRPYLLLVGVFVGASVLGVALGPVTATDHFRISSEDSQPVPERTFEFRNTTYQLDSFIVADPGDEINVSVSGPDEAYRLYVYNSDRQLVDSRATVGNDTFTFDLVGYEPGTYALTVYQSGDYEAIEALVVQEYNVSVVTAEQTRTDEGASIQVEVERNGSDSDPDTVRVVVSSGEQDLVVNATGSDGDYVANVESGALESGNYTVYGMVQGDAEVFGRNEVLGVSESVRLSVRNATTTSTPGANETTAPPSEPTPTPTATATRTETGATQTATAPGTTETAAAETEASGAEESEITPNVDEQPETTTGTGPGFSVAVTAVAVALALALALRGRRV